MSEPTVTRVDDVGHVVIQWPDPPRPTYEVAAGVIAQLVDQTNRIADLVELADMAGSVSASMIREVLLP